MKGGKYPKAKVGKYIYAVREGRQYGRIQLAVAHDVTWDNWCRTIRGRENNK